MVNCICKDWLNNFKYERIVIMKAKVLEKVAELVGLDVATEKGKYLIEKVYEKIEDEIMIQEYIDEIKNCSDDELKLFVPTVYQEDIYSIDYQKLKDAGITLLTFDIDDTIYDSISNKVRGYLLHQKELMPQKAVNLFAYLKLMGFTVALITNTGVNVAKPVCEQLKADSYIANAKKPNSTSFEEMQKRYGAEKSQMAHIGNSMRDDIYGGNNFGITTCLVRRNGIVMKIFKFIKNTLGRKTKGQIIRKELLKRDMWRKHHKDVEGDQYYQLGDIPRCRKR